MSRGAIPKTGQAKTASETFDFEDFKTCATQKTVENAFSSIMKKKYKNAIKLIEDAIKRKDKQCYDEALREFDDALKGNSKAVLNTLKEKYEEMKQCVVKAKSRGGDHFRCITLKDERPTESPVSNRDSPLQVAASPKPINSRSNDNDASTHERLLSIEALFKPENKDDPKKKQAKKSTSKKPTTDDVLDSIEKYCNEAIKYKRGLVEKTEENERLTKRLRQVRPWIDRIVKQVNDSSLNEDEFKNIDNDIKCDDMDSILEGVGNLMSTLKNKDDERNTFDEELTQVTEKLLRIINDNNDFKPGTRSPKHKTPNTPKRVIDVCLSELNLQLDEFTNLTSSLQRVHQAVDETSQVLNVTKPKETGKKHDENQPIMCLKRLVDSLKSQLSELESKCQSNLELVKETDKEIEDLETDINDWTNLKNIQAFGKDKKGSLSALRSARVNLLARKKKKEEKSPEKRVKKLKKLCVESGIPEPTVKEKNENEMAIVELLEQHLKREREFLKSVEKELVELQEDKTKYKANKEKTDVNALLQMAKDAKVNLQNYKSLYESHQRTTDNLHTVIEDLCKENGISGPSDNGDKYLNMLKQLQHHMKEDMRELEQGFKLMQNKNNTTDTESTEEDKVGIKTFVTKALNAKEEADKMKKMFEDEKKRADRYKGEMHEFWEQIEPDLEGIICTLKGQEKHHINQGIEKHREIHENQHPLDSVFKKAGVIKTLSEKVLSSQKTMVEIILNEQQDNDKRRSVIGSANYLIDEVTKRKITWQNVTSLKKRTKDMETDLREWKGEASYWKDQAIKEENEKNDYMTRLSKIASANLTNDNPNIADLSDPNRQTKLAEEYSQLYDNEWTNAFEEVEKKPDLNPIDYLRDILTTVYDECAEIRRLQIKKIKISVLQPAKLLTEISKPPSPEADKDESAKQKGSKQETKKKPNRPLPPTPVPGDQTKVTLGKLQSKAISEVVKQSYADALLDINRYFSSSYETYFTTPHLKAYTTKCIELCWLMNIHSPPVCLGPIAQKGAKFDKNIYREYTARGTKVEFVVWPAILLHENGPLLGKGVAQGMK